MAPKIAKKKNQTNGNNNSLATEKGDPAPGITDYVHQQNDELDVLRAIYDQDFTEVETKAAWGNRQSDRAFQLRLRPISQADVGVSITLSVRLTATYPKSLPDLSLENPEGIRPKTLMQLSDFIKSKPKELLGEVMIYEIASGIQDKLEDEAQFKAQGQTLPSLEEERVKHEADLTKQSRLLEEEDQRRKKEAEAEEDKALQHMVEEEMSRRRDMKKKSRPISTLMPIIDNNAELIHFDRAVRCQNGGTSFEFSAVTASIELSNGPLTRVSTVQPILAPDTTDQGCLLVVKQLSLQLCSPNVKQKIVVLEDELETLRKLNHPNIAHILDFRVDFNDTWSISILMEYARRGSLSDQMATFGILPTARVRIWTVELLEAVDFYHRNGIVHKRIHPNNVLLVQQSVGSPLQVRLSDAAFQETLYECKNDYIRKTSVSSFSAYWNPPEGSDKSRKSDIWELGIVFLQMLFGLETTKRFTGPIPLLDSFSLTEPLEEIIRRFFKPDAKKRPSAFDLIPSEFLRTNVEVYLRRSSPVQSRHGSMNSIHVPVRQRLRRESSGAFGAIFSRYAAEWVEIGRLGKGGYGEVVKARNKMDGGVYAIKKIKQKTASALTDVLSEVMLLSRLNHPYVVRYYTAWPEEEEEILLGIESEDTVTTTTLTDEATEDDILPPGQFPKDESLDFGQSTTGGLDFISFQKSSGFPKIQFGNDSDDESEEDVSSSGEEVSSEAVTTNDVEKSGRNRHNSASHNALGLRRTSSSRYPRTQVRSTLYIQMEYCEKHTLRDLIRKGMEDEEAWRLFRQILEGLNNIHDHGIIHRDLKPDNIFIDVANNPKIGDLGLATSGQYHLADRATSGSRATGGDMTRSIGTTYYVAPEIRSEATGSYNDKVDMYSLGIIFFEMTFQLKTAMERDRAIRAIREKDHGLPAAFESSDKTLQGSIILSLISHKPSERPSSSELLHSGKIPLKIEDETIRRALEGLSDPTSPHYHQMMTALFSQTPSKQIKDYTWDLGTASGIHDANESTLLMRTLVKERLVSIFHRHGAIETQRQTLLPRSSHYVNNNVVQLLDSSGTLVQLPYDLILPHARALSRKYPVTDKSYAFGNVFRQTIAGGAPQTSGEVDFDIVSHDTLDLALKEAEVIKVLDEVMEEFPGIASAQMCFHLNHADLLDLILEFCRISVPQRSAVKEQISRLNIQDFTWARIRNELRAPALGVPSTSLDDMSRFDFRDTIEKAVGRINTLFEGTSYYDRARACIKHLRDVVSYLKVLGIHHRVYICPLSAINEKFYTGGLLFQCLFDRKKRAVLAAGGRYDRLIQEHKPKVQGLFTGCHAVGFNLSWDRLVVSMDKFHSGKTKASSFLRKDKDEEPIALWKTRRCDVLVSALDDTALRTSGLKVLSELWANDISAELAVNCRTMDDIMTKYRDGGHSWAVMIKHDSVAGGRADVKFRSFATREDSDVKAENLISHILSELRERDAAEGKGKYHRRQHLHGSETTNSTSKRQNVQVLVAQHRSKKSNKWNIVEAVQSRAQSLLAEYGNAPIAAVETRDEVLDMVSGARLSDVESWRRLVHSVPINEREYIQQIHQLLEGFKTEWLEDKGEKCRMAFVSNFRTGHVILFDLGL